MVRIIAVLLSTFVLFACATGPTMRELQSQIPALSEGKGRIHFYRESSPFGAAIQPIVWLNGKNVGETIPGGVFYRDVSPGNYTVKIATEVKRIINFELKAGQNRYVRMEVGIGVMAARITPLLVPEQEAKPQVMSLSLIK